MRKLALLVVLVLAIPSLSGAAAGSVAGFVCSYESYGIVGQLTIASEPGHQFVATDSQGAVVAAGVTCGAQLVLPIMGAAEGSLRVHVDGGVLLLVDRDSMWD